MKLWFDDIREAPDDSWIVARTVTEAQSLLEAGQFIVCSLDHDLGLGDPEAEGFPGMTDPDGLCGTDLAKWMRENDHRPSMVILHSWNPQGRIRMAAYLPGAHNAPYGTAAFVRLVQFVKDEL